MTALISVIIPCYNEENFIGNTLDSVLTQKNSNIEIIVVDDGSKDRTREIVSQYANSYKNIKYIFQTNSGVSVARNTGIKNSIGEFLIFLDADDSYKSEDSLARLVKEMKASKADMLYCGYLERQGNNMETIPTEFTKENLLEKYLLGNVKAQTNCWMYRRKFILDKNLKFNKALKIGEDIHFISLALSLANQTSYVSDHLIVYNLDESENGLGVINFEKIEKDILFFNVLLQEESIRSKNRIKKVIIQYKRPAHLVNTLLELYKMNENQERIIDYYSKYRNLIYQQKSIMLNRPYFNLAVKRIYLNLLVKRLIRKKGRHSSK